MIKCEIGIWENEFILYENKKDSKITINQQIMDLGEFGVGEARIVKLKPLLKYWIIVTKLDTTMIDKDEWLFVNRFGGFNKGFD